MVGVQADFAALEDDELPALSASDPRVIAVASGVVGGVVMAMYEMIAVGLCRRGVSASARAHCRIGGRHEPPLRDASWGPVGRRTRHSHDHLGFLGAPSWAAGTNDAQADWITVCGNPCRVVVGTGGVLLMGVIIGPALDPALREAHPTHYLVAHLLYGLCSVVVLRAWMGRQRCRPHAAKRSLVEERARARARSDTIV